jgi:hypothetical protein
VSITEEWQKRILPNLDGEHLVLVRSGGLDTSLPLPDVALISGIRNPGDLGAGAISIGNSVGSMLSRLGVHPPFTPSSHQTERWNWLGNSPNQWQTHVGSSPTNAWF